MPFTATDEYLFAWAALIGVYRKEHARDRPRAVHRRDRLVLPSGAPLTRRRTPYATTADGTVDATGLLTVPIVAAVNGAGRTPMSAWRSRSTLRSPASIRAGSPRRR